MALAFSPDPGFGIPAVRKMVVYLMLLIVYSSVRTVAEAKWLVLAWIGVGTFTAGRGLVQYAADVAGARAAHTDFYHFYIADRIRGFMSHWMTFSGQELFILLLVAAFLLFAPDIKKWRGSGCRARLVVGIALILSDTRSVWIAALVAGLLSALGVEEMGGDGDACRAGAGTSRRARRDSGTRAIVSASRTGETDSNEHRKIVWRTGWQMIKAHPIVGVGPEEIRKNGGLRCLSAGRHPLSVARRRLSASAQHLYSLRGGVRRARRACS